MMQMWRNTNKAESFWSYNNHQVFYEGLADCKWKTVLKIRQQDQDKQMYPRYTDKQTAAQCQ